MYLSCSLPLSLQWRKQWVMRVVIYILWFSFIFFFRFEGLFTFLLSTLVQIGSSYSYMCSLYSYWIWVFDEMMNIRFLFITYTCTLSMDIMNSYGCYDDNDESEIFNKKSKNGLMKKVGIIYELRWLLDILDMMWSEHSLPRQLYFHF